MSGYYSNAQPAQSRAGFGGSDLVPKVTLNTKGSADEPYIDVTIQWGGHAWKTWRWQLKRKGKKLKLVALGEIRTVQDYDTAAIPPRAGGAEYSVPWSDPYTPSYEVVPNTRCSESTCTDETSDDDGNYTLSPSSSRSANEYTYFPDGGGLSKPRSLGDN